MATMTYCPRSIDLQPTCFQRITDFDLEVERLGLNPDKPKTLIQSTALRYWARRHRNYKYVPEWLLNTWGMVVDPEFSRC